MAPGVRAGEVEGPGVQVREEDRSHQEILAVHVLVVLAVRLGVRLVLQEERPHDRPAEVLVEPHHLPSVVPFTGESIREDDLHPCTEHCVDLCEPAELVQGVRVSVELVVLCRVVALERRITLLIISVEV